jgi:hypothetical protein
MMGASYSSLCIKISITHSRMCAPFFSTFNISIQLNSLSWESMLDRLTLRTTNKKSKETSLLQSSLDDTSLRPVRSTCTIFSLNASVNTSWIKNFFDFESLLSSSQCHPFKLNLGGSSKAAHKMEASSAINRLLNSAESNTQQDSDF